MLRLIRTGSYTARAFSDSGVLRQRSAVKNNMNDVDWKSVDIFEKLETKIWKNDNYSTRKEVNSVDPANVDQKKVDQRSFGDYSMVEKCGVSEDLMDMKSDVKDVTDETIASEFSIGPLSEVYDAAKVGDLNIRSQVQSIFDQLKVKKLVRLVHSTTPFGDQFLKLLSGLTLKSSFKRHLKLVRHPETGEFTILRLDIVRDEISKNGTKSPMIHKTFSVDLSNHMKNPEFQIITNAFAVAIFLEVGTGFKFEELNEGNSLEKTDLNLDNWSTFQHKIMPPDAESGEFEFDANKLLLFEEQDAIPNHSKSVFSRAQYITILRHFNIKPADFRSPPGESFLEFLRFLATHNEIHSCVKIVHMDRTKEDNRAGFNPFVKQILIKLGTGETTVEFILDLEVINGNHFESWTDCFVESIVNEYYKNDSFIPSIRDLLISNNGLKFSQRVLKLDLDSCRIALKPWCETPSSSLLDNTSFLQISTSGTDKTEILKFPALDRTPHPLFIDLIRYLNDNRSDFLFLFKPNYFHCNKANRFTAGSNDLDVIFNQNKLTIILNHQRFIMSRKPGENVTERTEKLAYFLMDCLGMKNQQKRSAITEIDLEDGIWKVSKYCDINRLLRDYSKTLKRPFTNRTTKYMLGKIYSEPILEREFNKWYHTKFDKAFDVVVDPDKATLESCLEKSRNFAKMITNNEMLGKPVDMEIYNRQRILDVIDKFETTFDKSLSEDLEAREAFQILKEEVKSIRTIREVILDIESKKLEVMSQSEKNDDSEKWTIEKETSSDIIDTGTEDLTEIEVAKICETAEQTEQKLTKSQKRNKKKKNKKKKPKQKMAQKKEKICEEELEKTKTNINICLEKDDQQWK